MNHNEIINIDSKYKAMNILNDVANKLKTKKLDTDFDIKNEALIIDGSSLN